MGWLDLVGKAAGKGGSSSAMSSMASKGASKVGGGADKEMIDNASKQFKEMAKEQENSGQMVKGFITSLADMVIAYEKMQVEMMQNTRKAAEFANKLADIDFQHATFGFEWEIRLKNIQLESEQLKIQGQRMALREKQLQLEITNADIGIESARINMASAVLNAQKAEYAMAEAAIRVKQAANNVTNAIFSYRTAVLNSQMADLDYQNKVFDIKVNLFKAKKAAAEADKAYKDEIAKLYEPWLKLDDAASKYVKGLGGNLNLMKGIKKDALDLVNSEKLQTKFNISAEEIIQIQMKYNQELGRNIRMTKEQMKGLAAMKAVYGDENTLKLATALDRFGYDFDRSSKLAGKMFKDASAKGISLGTASKMFLDNIKMAQNYTFSDGVRGLAKMAEKAASIRLNIAEIGKASDKVSTLKGAAEAAVAVGNLGGNFAKFASPLALLNEATRDMEGLSDRIIAMFDGLAEWDSQKGEISMSAENRYKMKTASEYLGMDSNALTDMVFNQARRRKVSPQVDKLDLNDTLKELLKNVAQLDKQGNAYINYGGEKKTMNDLSNIDPASLEKALRIQTQTDSENLADIAVSTRSLKDISDGWTKGLNDTMASQIENSETAKNFNERMIQQTEDATYHVEMAQKILDYGYKEAELTEEQSKWKAYYAEATYGFRQEMAAIDRDKTKFGVTLAETSEAQARLNKIKAERFEPQQARITKWQADNQQRSADAAVLAAKYNKESVGIDQQQYELDKKKYEVEKKQLELDNVKIAFQYIKESSLDATYGDTRAAAKSAYYIGIAQSYIASVKSGLEGDVVGMICSFLSTKDLMDKSFAAEKVAQDDMKELFGVWNDREGLLALAQREQAQMQIRSKTALEEVLDNNISGRNGRYKGLTGYVEDRLGGWSHEQFAKFASEHAGHAYWDAEHDKLRFDAIGEKAYHAEHDKSGGGTIMASVGLDNIKGRFRQRRAIKSFTRDFIKEMRHASYPDNYPYIIMNGNKVTGLAMLQGGEAIIPTAAAKQNAGLIRKIINSGNKPLGQGYITSNDVSAPSWWMDVDYDNPNGVAGGYITINLNGDLFSISINELIGVLKEDKTFMKNLASAVLT